jgi:hypothetical protein
VDNPWDKGMSNKTLSEVQLIWCDLSNQEWKSHRCLLSKIQPFGKNRTPYKKGGPIFLWYVYMHINHNTLFSTFQQIFNPSSHLLFSAPLRPHLFFLVHIWALTFFFSILWALTFLLSVPVSPHLLGSAFYNSTSFPVHLWALTFLFSALLSSHLLGSAFCNPTSFRVCIWALTMFCLGRSVITIRPFFHLGRSPITTRPLFLFPIFLGRSSITIQQIIHVFFIWVGHPL